MSTKIYTGFKFSPDMTLMKIHHAIMDFRQEAKVIKNKNTAKWLANRSIDLFDSHTLNFVSTPKIQEDIEKNGCLSTAFVEIKHRQREMEKTKLRDPAIDFSFSLSIIPIKDKILGIYFAENQELIDAWNNKPYIIEYHYQNQADKPSDISDQEWNQREQDWEEAIPYSSSVPAMNGFVADITESAVAIPDCDEIIKCIPDFQKRVHDLATRLLFKERYDEKFKDKESVGTGDTGAFMFGFRDWLKTKEGKKMLKKHEKEVKTKLKKKITKEDLFGEK